jgi:propionyl-CoA synthetase
VDLQQTNLQQEFMTSEAKLIISASCGFEPGRTVQYKPLLDEAIRLAAVKPKKCVIFQKRNDSVELGVNDISWQDFIKNAKEIDCEHMDANDPAYILYTSGTTGTPKGIVRDIGGHIVALKWSMKNIYNINPGDVLVVSERYWLGGWSLLYCLWTIVSWLHNNNI